MIITQVTPEYAKENSTNPNLYRVITCDDGRCGHHHISARLKPVKNCTVEEFSEALRNPDMAFILIDPGY